ncbi:hypothetical protein EVAR_91332_1 [Eumeta japonica]|uniref:Uncharacterized protein n=1 Tax=Eumeta variegata TaxID=151549 RepID=A0A4C1SXB5_EUMVA|nr:hypothetical protein EVAR_91332_1 [Eumeta japonica]
MLEADNRIGTQPRLAEFSLGITLGLPTPWYRYYNPRVGLEEQSLLATGLLFSEDSVRHYQTEALLGLYPR